MWPIIGTNDLHKMNHTLGWNQFTYEIFNRFIEFKKFAGVSCLKRAIGNNGCTYTILPKLDKEATLLVIPTIVFDQCEHQLHSQAIIEVVIQ